MVYGCKCGKCECKLRVITLKTSNWGQMWGYLELASHMSLVTHALPKRALRVIYDKVLLFYIIGLWIEKGSDFRDFRSHQSPARQTIFKWTGFGTGATLPKNGHRVKMRIQQSLISDVKKQPWVMAKDWKTSLELAYICIQESTGHKTLNKQPGHHRGSCCLLKRTFL